MNQRHPFCDFVCFVYFVVKIRVLIPNSGCQVAALARVRAPAFWRTQRPLSSSWWTTGPAAKPGPLRLAPAGDHGLRGPYDR